MALRSFILKKLMRFFANLEEERDEIAEERDELA